MPAEDLPSVWLDPAPAIESDWLPTGARYDVVVVGAGLTGLATAVLLAGAGRQVAVLEARSVGAVTDRPLDGEGLAASDHRAVQDREKPF